MSVSIFGGWSIGEQLNNVPTGVPTRVHRSRRRTDFREMTFLDPEVGKGMLPLPLHRSPYWRAPAERSVDVTPATDLYSYE